MFLTKLKRIFASLRLEPQILLFFIVLSGLLLRLPNLNESLWYDELFSTRYKIPNLKELAYFSVFDVHPPFYSVLIFLWTGLFGDSEISVRILPLIFGIASIILIYVLACRVADEKTALVAAFLLSFSPVHIWYSQEARLYSALVFFILFAIIAQLKLTDSDVKPVWFFIYSFVIFAGVFSHYFFIFYVFLITLIVISGNSKYKKHILAVNAATVFFLGLLVVIKFLKSAIKTQQSDWRAFSFWELKQLFFNWFLLGGNCWDATRYYWWIIAVQIIFMVIFLFGVIFLLEKSNRLRGSREILLLLFTLPLFLLIISGFGQKGYIERSTITSLPFFFIVIAAGATAFKNKIVSFACISLIIVVSVATVAAFYSRQDFWTVYKPNADWRTASKYLNDNINADTFTPEVFTVTTSEELMYYNPRFKQIINNEIEFTSTDQELQNKYIPVNEIKIQHIPKIYDKMITDKKQRFYLIHNNYWAKGSIEISDQLKADKRFVFKSQQSFKGIDIYCFDLAQ